METYLMQVLIIYGSCILALLWGAYNLIHILTIKPYPEQNIDGTQEEELIDSFKQVLKIAEKIRKGANLFIFQEYTILFYFVTVFSIVILIFVDLIGSSNFRCYTFVCYLIGSVISMIFGVLGMKIAVESNFRTAYKAKSDLHNAFNVAYRGGSVMGFWMTGVSLGLLLTIILVSCKVFDPIYEQHNTQGIVQLMEYIAGYGLGGSSVALFRRVSGGIYTKAADIGADQAGKLESTLDEDSLRNPAIIADQVGDNVGDISGMGSDLFGLFAEATGSALILIASHPTLSKEPNHILFPLLISAIGIYACFLTSFFGLFIRKVKMENDIEFVLLEQLIISTTLIDLGLYFISKYFLPSEWEIPDQSKGHWYFVFACMTLGLIAQLLIGISTEYFISKKKRPVQEMAQACISGPAVNIIYAISFGYLSCFIPIAFLGITLLVSIKLLGLMGVALTAVGMLSNLAIGLSISAFGPISDNAEGLAKLSQLGPEVRKITEALDSAGNTTTAIGKAFTIGTAALVSLALYGAFVTQIKSSELNTVKNVEITDPWIFCSLLYGASLPFIFSGLTMKSVGLLAQEMIKEVHKQLGNPRIKTGEEEPNYDNLIRAPTVASIKAMILPAAIVIFSPILLGIVFHPLLVAGFLPGALLSGIYLAISMSNTGGALDNCKKLIESEQYVTPDGVLLVKQSKEYKAAVIGDTVGDPMKDTSGPSLSVVIKLMAIISLVFANTFSKTALLAKFLDIKQ